MVVLGVGVDGQVPSVSSAEVLHLYLVAKLPIPPSRKIASAGELKLKNVVESVDGALHHKPILGLGSGRSSRSGRRPGKLHGELS